VLDTTSFLPKLCHHALNVHVCPFLIVMPVLAIQPVNGITRFGKNLGEVDPIAVCADDLGTCNATQVDASAKAFW
jgi:hypothetical protein